MFNSKRPDSLGELLEIIDNGDYYIFAGGTDLFIRKRQWQGAERRFDRDVVFISHLEELRGIFEDRNYFKLRTCVTQDEVANSELLPDYLRIPYSLMGNPAIRNTATVGGNIVNAAKVADSLPLFYALDAAIVLKSIQTDRVLSIKDFIFGRYRTDRYENEIIYEVIIPKEDFTGYRYKKIGSRKSSILSKLSVFIVYKKAHGKIVDIRISVGAVNEVPIRSEDGEKEFIKDNNIDKFLLTIREMMEGEDDRRSTKLYREEISLRVIKSFLEEIIEE
jgi:CO/xanthine dehydrogenase FAD-binding subunit